MSLCRPGCSLCPMVGFLNVSAPTVGEHVFKLLILLDRLYSLQYVVT
jgi:hypothetical protein